MRICVAQNNENSNQIKATVKDIEYFQECNEVISNNVGVLGLSLLKTGMSAQYTLFFQSNLGLVSWLIHISYKICLEFLKIKEPKNEYCEQNTHDIYCITLNDIRDATKLLSRNNSNESKAKMKLKSMQQMQEYLKLNLKDDIEIEPPPTEDSNLSTLSIRDMWLLYSCWSKCTKKNIGSKTNRARRKVFST